MEAKQYIQCPETDAIPGLEFRHFAGEEDYQLMLDLYNACKDFNGSDWTAVLDDMKNDEKWRKHYDINEQLIFVEFNGQPIGDFSYNWSRQDPGDIILRVGLTLKEEFFNAEIPQAMLAYQERKLVEMTASETQKGNKLFSIGRKMKGTKQIEFATQGVGAIRVPCQFFNNRRHWRIHFIFVCWHRKD